MKCGVCTIISFQLYKEQHMKAHEKKREEEIINAMHFHGMSHKFLEAANTINSAIHVSYLMDVRYYLICHALELGLKAFLRAQGIKIDVLRNLKHNLEKILTMAKKEGLASICPAFSEYEKDIIKINEDYSIKGFEYTVLGGTGSYPPFNNIYDSVELLLKDIWPLCLENSNFIGKEEWEKQRKKSNLSDVFSAEL